MPISFRYINRYKTIEKFLFRYSIVYTIIHIDVYKHLVQTM